MRVLGTRPLVWIVCAIAAPLSAHWLIGHSRDAKLIPSLESVCQEPVTVGAVSVSLFGALELTDVRISDMISAEAVSANLSLSALLSGQLKTAEIVLAEPQANLRDRGQRLRRLMSRLRNLGSLGKDTKTESGSSNALSPKQLSVRSLPNIRVRGGSMRIDAGADRRVLLFGLAVRPTERGLRVVFDEAHASVRIADRNLTAVFGRGAADVDVETASISRLLVGDGSLQVRNDARRQATATGLEISYGIDDPSRTDIRGSINGGLFRGSLHGGSIELSMRSIPAESIAGLLGTGDFERGKVSGNFSVRTTTNTGGLKGYAVTGSLEVRDARAQIDWLEKEAIEGSARWVGTAKVHHRVGHGWELEVGELQMELGRLSTAIAGTVTLPSREWKQGRANLSLLVAPIQCSEFVESVPRGLLGPLHGVRVAGELSGTVRLKVAQPNSRPVELDVDLSSSSCRVSADAPYANVAALGRSYVHTTPSGRNVKLGRGADGFIGLSTLPSYVPAAFLAAEDSRFHHHDGFDARQIESSIAKDLNAGRFARGGSTISQQLAKNLFLSRERTLGRKLKEAVLAWRLESVHSKDQILEHYLNIIQLAESVYGIDAASRRWFDKSASQLSPREAAFLASLTRAPTFTSRAIATGGGMTPAMVKRVEHILKSMHFLGAIDESTLARERRSQLRLTPTVATLTPQ